MWFSVLKLGCFVLLNIWFKVKRKFARNSVLVIFFRCVFFRHEVASWSHTGTPRPKLGNHRHALDQVHAGSSQGQAEDGHSKSWVYWVCGMLMNILLGPLLDVAGNAFAPAALIAPFTSFRIVIDTAIAARSQ